MHVRTYICTHFQDHISQIQLMFIPVTGFAITSTVTGNKVLVAGRLANVFGAHCCSPRTRSSYCRSTVMLQLAMRSAIVFMACAKCIYTVIGWLFVTMNNANTVVLVAFPVL